MVMPLAVSGNRNLTITTITASTSTTANIGAEDENTVECDSRPGTVGFTLVLVIVVVWIASRRTDCLFRLE